MAADHNFMMQLATTIASIASCHSDGACRVFVFHDGYSPEDQERVELGGGAAVKIEWIDARSDAYRDAHIQGERWQGNLPAATLFRLRTANLVPSDVGRAIYLDADLIVLHPLTELFRTDLGDFSVGAVRDPIFPWAGQRLPWRELDLSPRTPYFNAGVMVMDLDKWRADGLEEACLGLMAKHHFAYADQCALNAFFRGGWHQLHPRWNLQTGHFTERTLAWIAESVEAMDEAIADPAIFHYTNEALRPWRAGSKHPRRDQWLAALDKTAWAGWRPKPRNAAVRAAGRLQRASQALTKR